MELTCRICFKSSTTENHHKFMEIEVFLPIIKMLSRTQIFSCDGSPDMICGSCAQGLIMANLFRMKVIESNAICQELYLDSKNLQNFDEILHENDVKEEFQGEIQGNVTENLEMQEEYLHESFLEATEIDSTLNVSKNLVEVKPVSMKSDALCAICMTEIDVNGPKIHEITNILEIISPKIDLPKHGRVCKECKRLLKYAASFFKRRKQGKLLKGDMKIYTMCQICFKRCRKVEKTSREIAKIYFSLPKLSEESTIMVGGRSCSECNKYLMCIGGLQKLLNGRIEIEMTSINGISSENFTETLNYDSDSDASLVEVPFGEPLNIPAAPQYFSCTFCDFKSINDLEIAAHIAIIHETTSEICEFCNKIFKNKSDCRAHKRQVHFSDLYGNLDKKLCELCGLLTMRLDPHHAFHLNVRPFSCDLCGHQSRTKLKIKMHILAVHTNYKSYGCRYCEMRFSYHSDMARHEIHKHTKNYKYVCETCNNCFLKKIYLTTHELKHSKVNKK